MNIFRILILLISGMMPSTMFAVTQGSLGTTSTGTVSISITIPSLVQASGLTDVTIPTITSFSSPATASTTACIYSNITSPAGSYYVTAISTNASGTAFRVKDSGTNYITYNAYWNNAQSTGGIQLGSGVKTAQQTGGSATSLTCGGTPNANFNISFSAAQVENVPAATYTDVVNLVISPT